MIKKLAILFLSLVVVAAFGLQIAPATAAQGVPTAPSANGACGCPGNSHCCYDCNGNVLCVRHILECPICPGF